MTFRKHTSEKGTQSLIYLNIFKIINQSRYLRKGREGRGSSAQIRQGTRKGRAHAHWYNILVILEST